MQFLFKVEEVFDIPGRGCVIVPPVADGADFKIGAGDAIQLRTPVGAQRNTHIGSIELLKPVMGTCRIAILLPPEVQKQNVPQGTEVWLTG